MITIREAKEADSSFIVQFQLQMALETENLVLDETILQKGVAAVFADRLKGCYFVAEENGRVIASTLLTPEWSDWRNRTIQWIQSVYVVPEYRRKGVFKAMYGYIRSKVDKDRETGGIRLYVDSTNISAQKTYAALGMNGDHYRVFEWMK